MPATHTMLAHASLTSAAGALLAALSLPRLAARSSGGLGRRKTAAVWWLVLAATGLAVWLRQLAPVPLGPAGVPGAPAAGRVPPDAWPGTVTRVMDGDTLDIETPAEKVKVRLWGVDAPENGQAAGPQAREYLSRLVEGRPVYVRPRDTDRYGRTVAVVYTREGVSVNEQLLAEGWAWWYQEYAPKDTVARTLEAQARKGHRGLWASASPTPPWEYRKAARRGYGTSPGTGSRPGRYRPEKGSGSR